MSDLMQTSLIAVVIIMCFDVVGLCVVYIYKDRLISRLKKLLNIDDLEVRSYFLEDKLDGFSEEVEDLGGRIGHAESNIEGLKEKLSKRIFGLFTNN